MQDALSAKGPRGCWFVCLHSKNKLHLAASLVPPLVVAAPPAVAANLVQREEPVGQVEPPNSRPEQMPAAAAAVVAAATRQGVAGVQVVAKAVQSVPPPTKSHCALESRRYRSVCEAAGHPWMLPHVSKPAMNASQEASQLALVAVVARSGFGKRCTHCWNAVREQPAVALKTVHMLLPVGHDEPVAAAAAAVAAIIGAQWPPEEADFRHGFEVVQSSHIVQSVVAGPPLPAPPPVMAPDDDEVPRVSQNEAPAVENVPTEHASHLIEPSLPAKKVAGHSQHSDEPT